MELKAYLHSTMMQNETHKSRYERFAKRLDVSVHCLRKWLNGERRINDAMKIEIQRRTSGLVTLEDLVRQ
jgi:DNA-binding transcriptional regulator YdaS (Cro superfamily)